jgi:hypothetical protein
MKWLALLLIPTLAIGAPASVSGGKAGGLLSSAPTSASSQTTQTGHGGGSGRLREEELRNPPPLDPKREVTEQDCTKPVDLTKGNLKCK